MQRGNRTDQAFAFVLFGVAGSLVYENSLVFLFLNRDLGDTSQTISGYAQFLSSYALIGYLVGFVLYNQYVRKIFRYSWFVPVMYFVLCLYAAMRAEGRSVNSILGNICSSLASVACMLSCEYLVACAQTVTWRTMLDALFLFLCVFGSAMVVIQLMMFGVSNTGGFLATNNIYVVLPLLCYWMTKKTEWVVWGVPLLMIVIALLSLKRGAIIATMCMFCASEVLRRRRSGLVPSAFRIAFFLIVICGVYWFADQRLFHGYISERFETIADGSGRAGQFEWATAELERASFSELLVGHGMGASIIEFGMFLHNDWLLLLYDFGVIGMLIYACIYVYFLKTARRLWRQNSPYTAAWAACCVFCVCLSLYSAVTWVYIFNVLPVMGCILGLERRRVQPSIRQVFMLQRQNAVPDQRGASRYDSEPRGTAILLPEST